MVVILYCIKNNDEKKSLYMFSTDATILLFWKIFDLRLAESENAGPTDKEG